MDPFAALILDNAEENLYGTSAWIGIVLGSLRKEKSHTEALNRIFLRLEKVRSIDQVIAALGN